MHENLKYWLALNKIDQVGPVSLKLLYDHFASIEKVWKATAFDLRQVNGLRKGVVDALLKGREQIDLGDEIARLSGCSVLCLEDETYPANLKNIYAPPPVLYVNGDLNSSDQKAIAIVGTRQASHYGKKIAEQLAAELAGIGFTIVSGLALGIDTAAHRGAIASHGRTLAVLGSAIDCIYPAENKPLASQVVQSGALLSEFPLGTEPDRGSFPRRNRIISGLSMGVIVVEGGCDSGAMITANYALEQGREVFAIPGSLNSQQSKGPHSLIKQGAKLIESVDDILDELQLVLPRQNLRIEAESRPQLNLTANEQLVYNLLSTEPLHIDELTQKSALACAEVAGLLMKLELKQAIRQLPGKRFVLY